MKSVRETAGYDECCKAIRKARLKKPVVFDPMIMYYDPKKLADVRDRFGVDLYLEAMKEIEEEDRRRMTA